MKVAIAAMILVLPALLYGQDLIYTATNRSMIECDIDSSTIGKGIVKFRRFDQDGEFQVRDENVLFIKNYEGAIVYPKNVVGNIKSKLFHWPRSNHLPPLPDRVQFASIKSALDGGYKACPACMDFSPVIPDYLLERWLSDAARTHIQSTEVIVYDHPKLASLRKLMLEVVNGWPEPLKGYQYSLQVYDSPSPNAMSVGAGSIFVSTGLLDMLESPEETKAVLAHEIAHVERRHLVREYYSQQKKEQWGALGAFFAGAITTALGGDAKTVNAVTSLASVVAEIGVRLSKAGYQRELEEEADIFAQLYFQAQHLDKHQIFNAFDKIASYEVVRGVFDLGGGASSTHPDLRQRLGQLASANTTIVERKIEFVGSTKTKAKSTQDILAISLSCIYDAPSSTDPTEQIVYLVGHLRNLDRSLSLRLANLRLMLPGPDGRLSFDGVEDMIVYRGQTRDFTAYLRMQRENAAKLIDRLRDLSKAELSLETATLRISKKGSQQPTTFQPIETRFKLIGQ